MDAMITRTILQDRKITYVITDRNLTIVEVSDAVGIMGSNGDKAILGSSLLDLVPELIGSEPVLADILSGKLPRFELPWVNLELVQGQTIYLTLVNLPRRDALGQITGLIHLVQDVTEIGEVQQQLAQQRNELRLLQDQLTRQNVALTAANNELRALDELKSVFISTAAHELRTPLTSIMGFVEILLLGEADDQPLTSIQRDYLQIMQQSADHLTSIIRDLLDVTRIEAGHVELTLQSTNLAGLIEAVAAEFGPQFGAKKQRLVLHAQPDLPFALCDKTRTVQIISNLLSNASKYTPAAGVITVNLTLAREAGFLQVAVADNGVGIATEDHPKLFKRFYRAQSAAMSGARGTGLGLYITRSLAELHGGRIWFESELDKGSTFYVTLPVAGAPVAA